MMPYANPRQVGVIDIGSNSVRLVIYEVWRAAFLPVFNEKVMAGLGEGLSETGRLSPEGVNKAFGALRRFRAILDGLGVSTWQAVATAAVRDAGDGPAFASAAREALGTGVRILPGREEGRLSALGVRSGFAEVDGLVGDLGGSSLEFHAAGNGGAVGETHRLGPFALPDGLDADPPALRKHVRAVLRESALLGAGAEQLYAVGGAWRAFAKLHMSHTHYPLRVLDGYRMSADDVTRLSEAVTAQSASARGRGQLQKLVGRRAKHLMRTAIVLDETLRAGRIGAVVVSSHGLRDGVVAELVGREDGDPLLDGITSYARLLEGQVAFGAALARFVRPAIDPPGETALPPGDDRIIRAACLLADTGARFHPDHRATLVYDQVLRAPYAAISHRERAFLALAVAARYSRKVMPPASHKGLIDSPARDRARRLGALMRVGAIFSGRSASILQAARLERTPADLRLVVPASARAMVSETVRQRLEQAAALSALRPDVDIEAS